MIDLDDAVFRAQATLSEGLRIDRKSALANPLQNLWILSYIDEAHPDDVLLGGGRVVSANEVREIGSDPSAPEYTGVVWPCGD